MHHSRTTANRDGLHHQQQGPSPPADVPSSSVSRSSFMAKFYTPMNLGTESTSPPPPPLHQQQQQQQQLPPQPLYTPMPLTGPATRTSTSSAETGGLPSLGPDAALMVARLAATPGFLTAGAIAEARQEYMAVNHQQQQQQQQQGYDSHFQQQQYQYQASVTSAAHDPLSWKTPPMAMETYASSHQSHSGPWHRNDQHVHPQQQNPPEAKATTSKDDDTPDSFVKNGKMTPKLIKRLADLVESNQGTSLKNQLSVLQQKQNDKERELFNRRKDIVQRHSTELNSLQAKEIMGVNVAMERSATRKRHAKELRQFDRGVMSEMDQVIAEQQRILDQAGVPMMHPSSDPADIGVKIKIVRLLDDMLHDDT